AIALLLTSAGLTLAGCTGTTPGNATPATSSIGARSSAASSNPFNGLQACAVLDKVLQGEGFPASHVEKSGGDNGCGSQKIGFGSVGLVLDDQQGIDTFTGQNVHAGTI